MYTDKLAIDLNCILLLLIACNSYYCAMNPEDVISVLGLYIFLYSKITLYV